MHKEGRPPKWRTGPHPETGTHHTSTTTTEYIAHADNLAAEAIAIRELSATVINATDIGTHAIEYAVNGMAVFPLRGKIPAIPKAIGGQGVLDATTDIAAIAAWWGGRYAGCNIGGRVPDGIMVLDVDPRHGGLNTLAGLENTNSVLDETLQTVSGRGDGGVHYWYRRPPGKLSSTRLGPGIDIKTSTGYVVLPPSIHPDSGLPYERIDRPVVAPPDWLVELLRPEKTAHTITPARTCSTVYGQTSGTFSGSIADQYSQTTSWAEILVPHGWTCRDADPDADGATWLHPTATSSCSATIRNGCIFIYSPNTPFEITESGNPHGYTKFRAYAVLNHGGNMSAAAKSLMAVA
jgi:hypothetical protein